MTLLIFGPIYSGFFVISRKNADKLLNIMLIYLLQYPIIIHIIVIHGNVILHTILLHTFCRFTNGMCTNAFYFTQYSKFPFKISENYGNLFHLRLKKNNMLLLVIATLFNTV